MIAVNIKPGVNVKGLKAPMWRAYEVYAGLYMLTGNTPAITSAVAVRDGPSLHPHGYAIDCRSRDLTHDLAYWMARLMQDKLTSDYDVIYKTDPRHFHIEYQRYLDDQEPWKIKTSQLILLEE